MSTCVRNKVFKFFEGFYPTPQGDDLALQKTKHNHNNTSSSFKHMFEQKE